MVITIPEVVKIREFDYQRILFPDLTEFFCKEKFDALFDCITNRSGVYYFFDNETRIVSYIGCIENRNIKKRIDQYRTPGDSGNSFWKNFQKKHTNPSFDTYQTHVQGLRFGTFSTFLNNETLDNNTESALKEVNKNMEDFLICNLHPIYNIPCNSGLTDNEQVSLMSALLEDAPCKRLRVFRRICG